MKNFENLYDVIIVGGGPAGLSAAIYAARAKYRVLVVEKEKIGGQITITNEVVNYPGILETNGTNLTNDMRKQAVKFGAEFEFSEVIGMELDSDIKTISTSNGEKKSLGVILCVGANPRKLGFKGEMEFQGRGIAYCATCDGEFFTGMDLYVIGGGFAAVEEGIFLTKYAKKVTIVVRKGEFSCAKSVSDKIYELNNMDVLFHTELEEVRGENMVSYARFRNNKTGEEWVHDAKKDGKFGVFVFVGYAPNTNWLPIEIEKDDHGYLITDQNQKTNLEGVYAAGDVCQKKLRQVVTAVSDGAVAATSLEKYLSDLHGKLNIPELSLKKTDQSETGKEIETRQENKKKSAQGTSSNFISSEMQMQLEPVFAKFQSNVILRLWLNNTDFSQEIKGFVEEFCQITEKVNWEIGVDGGKEPKYIPSIEFLFEDGRSSGIHFHSVPGGHEINSFIMALYNVAGPGKEIPNEIEEKIQRINEPVNIKVLISLSCTMCPDVVMATQKIASLSSYVQAEMFDLMHFEELKEKYAVMSVPCMIINDRDVSFGKKGIEEIVEQLLPR